jgi:hypothetical protein
MKINIAILLSNLLLFVTQLSCAQPVNLWKKIKINPIAKYEIVDEDKIISRADLNESEDTVSASIIVDNNELIKIRFSRAEVHGDTLQIVLYEDNEAFYNKFVISIVKDTYFIKYRFLIDISEDTIGTIIPYQSEVSLNKLEIKKGGEIRGAVKFKGRREHSQNEEWIIVNGNFKIII